MTRRFPAGWCPLLALLLFASPPSACTDEEESEMLSASAAVESAERGLEGVLGVQPDDFRHAARGVEPGPALLVERRDLGTFYYLVPFGRGGETTLVVIVDAADGSFQRTSMLRPPGVYPPLDAEVARAALARHLGGEAALDETAARLVWQPSHQSQSPYEPLWAFEAEGREWFVDSAGRVWDEIEEPRLKGGGPPGG